jgi:DNA-binding NtrC family response regulator
MVDANPISVLVVNEDPASLAALTRRFKREVSDFAVATARDRCEAIRMLASGDYQVVVSVIVTPESGLGLIMEIGRQWPGVRTLAVPGDALQVGARSLEDGQGLGARRKLRKRSIPFHALVAVIRDMLAEGEARVSGNALESHE